MNQATPEVSELTKNLVILVDDEESHLAEAQAYLEEAQFWVKTARTERATLDLIYSEPPSCFVMDYGVVCADEMALIRKIKSDNVYGHLPIVLLVTEKDVQQGIDWTVVPADDYIVKPLDKTELTSRVQLALARAQRDMGANPLTGLPGNLAILREAEKRITKNETFAMAYLDIDNFKAFNDSYGFSRGDEILRMTARVIVNSVLSFDDKDSMVGHIGGDDFVFITPAHLMPATCERIITDFDDITPAFYDEKDRVRGCLQAVDRQGVLREFPLVSVSIAVVDTSVVDVRHVGDLSARVAQVKKFVKQKTGSAYMIDRRK